MWIYLLIFLIPVVNIIFRDSDTTNFRSNKFLVFIMIGLCLFVGLGDMLGGFDRYIYGELFDRVADATVKGESYLSCNIFQLYPKEVGYTLLNILLSFITHNRYIFIFILTAFIYFFVYQSFKKYVCDYAFGLVLFLGLMFFFTFTYLRQVMAMGLIWFSIRYIIDRNFLKFFLLVAMAFSLHNSALIFLPMYFIVNRRYKMSILIMGLSVALILGVLGVFGTLFDAYGESVEATMRTDKYVEDAGFRFAYLFEALLFLLPILPNYKRLTEDKEQMVLCNLALIFCATLLFFIRSENGGRLSWFFMMGVISTLSTVFHNFTKYKNYRSLVIFISFILYFRILVQWGILLYPYKTFLTDGYRDNDRIFRKYEYDMNYSENKFYR